MAEEVGHQKLAAQYICRELRDADEANLLDEEGSFFNFLEDLYPVYLCVIQSNDYFPFTRKSYTIVCLIQRGDCSVELWHIF